MDLIVIAHRGEAQAFFKSFFLKPVEGPIKNLFCDNKRYLLLTGEGKIKSLVAICSCLSFLDNKITRVINLGISGILNKKIEKDSFYSVRTVYGENEFNSYTLDEKSNQDCISSLKRVLKDEYANELSMFAELVDMELWSIAHGCKTFNKKLMSFKWTSDQAGSQTDCLSLKDQAEFFSKKLLEKYLSLENQVELDVESNTSTPSLLKDFHLNFSFEKKYQKNINLLISRLNKTEEEILDLLEVNHIVQSFNNRKKRSAELLRKMETLINPFRTKIESKMIDALNIFKENQIQVSFDKTFENKKLNVHFEIHNQHDVERIKRSFENFKYSDVETIFEGQI